jgi:AraC-like DNA-binding protein
MIIDQLSEAFDLVEIRSMFTGGIAARGDWVSRGRIDHPLKFFALLSGTVSLRTEGVEEPIELRAGDVGILNGRSWVELRGGPGAEAPRTIEVRPDFPPPSMSTADRELDDVFVGGRIDLNEAGESLLLRALPPLSHVKAASEPSSGLRALTRQLLDELTGGRVGSAFAVRLHAQLLLLEMLRTHVEQTEPPPGWLRLLTDERLRPAVARIHAEPGRAWGLEELAAAAAMSRASFAERFRKVAGMPPVSYLNHWRMLMAQRALKDGETRIGPLAARLGYGSESAFSNAFKREVGVPPSHYRRQVRRAATGPARQGALEPA